MSRKKIAAGNWKMNTSPQEGEQLVAALAKDWADGAVEMIVGPPFTHLSSIVDQLKESSIKVAAQNCHQAAGGAFTGEVSAGMLQAIGVDYIIIGHSERRQYFHEHGPLLKEKVDAVLSAGLGCIFCCGEPLEVREIGGQNALVEQQIHEALFHLDAQALRNVVIAYEPIWAIGTGVTASPAQAQEMHAHIRGLLARIYDEAAAKAMTILYGGSIKPGNANELFGQPDVDGGLVGGASLKAPDFLQIAESLANS